MAKKRDDHELDDWDDFDLEGDFSFGEDGGFETADGPKGRNPVTRFIGSFKDGVKEKLFTKDTARKLVDSSLPASYSTAFEGALDTAGDTRFFIDDAKNEFGKVADQLKKEKRDELNILADQIPSKRLSEKFKNWTNTGRSDSNYGSNADQDKLAAAADLAAVFGEVKSTEQGQEQLKTMTKMAEVGATQAGLQTTANDILFGVSKDVSRLVKYQDTIGISFQRKLLETNLHQLFVQRKHLERVNKHYDYLEKAVPTLIQNTGLPDFVKLQQAEMVRQQMANRFVGNLTEGMYSSTATIRDRIFKKMKGELKNAAQQLYGMGDQLIGAGASMFSNEFGGKTDVASMLGEFAAGVATQKATEFVGNQLNDYISQNPELKKKIGKGDGILKTLRERMPGYMNDNLLNGNTGYGWLDSATSFFGLSSEAMRRKTRIQSGMNAFLEDPAIFNLRTQRAITDVIPGLLGRIHLELHKSNGGAETSPLQYDWNKGGFTTLKKSTDTFIHEKVATDKRAKELVETESAFLKKIDPDEELSGETRQKLANAATMAGIQGKDISLSHFIDPDDKEKYIPELAKFIKKKFNVVLEAGESKNIHKSLMKFAGGGDALLEMDRQMSIHRNKMASSFDDPAKELLERAKAGDISDLSRYDFIVVDSNGNYDIDYDKYAKYQRRQYAQMMSRRGGRLLRPMAEDNPFDVTYMGKAKFQYAGDRAKRGMSSTSYNGHYAPMWNHHIPVNGTTDDADIPPPPPPPTTPSGSPPVPPTRPGGGLGGFFQRMMDAFGSPAGAPPTGGTTQPVTPSRVYTPTNIPTNGALVPLSRHVPTPTQNPPTTEPTDDTPTPDTSDLPGDIGPMPPPNAGSKRRNQWFNKVKNALLKGTIGLTALGTAGAASASTGMTDLAVSGVTIGDGGTLALVAGGVAGAIYMYRKVGNKLRGVSPSPDQPFEDYPDDEELQSGKKVSKYQRRQRAKRNAQSQGNFNDKSIMAKTERHLERLIRQGQQHRHEQHGDFGEVIGAIHELAASGAVLIDQRGAFLRDAWNRAKGAGSKAWGFTKGYYNKLWGGTKWIAGKAKDALNWAKDKASNLWDKTNVLDTVKKGFGKAKSGIASYYQGLFNLGFGTEEKPGLTRKAWRGGKKLLNDLAGNAMHWKDGIFIEGEDWPRLDAVGLRMGKYRDEATGKVIKKLSDITGGNIVDENGVIVLTRDQINAGLYNKFGEKINSRMVKLKAVMDGTIGVAASMAKNLLSLPFRAAGWMMGVARNAKERLAKFKQDKDWGELLKFGAFTNSGRQLEEVIKIREMLEEKFKGPHWNDRDGDDDRDGSYQDLMDKRVKPDESEVKDKKEDKDEGVLKRTLGGLAGKLLPFLGSALTRVGGVLMKALPLLLKGAVPALLGGLAIPKALDWLGGGKQEPVDPNDPRLDPNSPHYDPNFGKPGMVGQAAGWLKEKYDGLGMVGKTVANVGVGYLGIKAISKAPGLLWKGAKGIAGFVKRGGAANTAARVGQIAANVGRSTLIRGALVKGAALMASPAAPLVLGALAVAGAAYVGWKIWKGSKRKDTPMLTIRMASYGYDSLDDKHVPQLLEVENLLHARLKKNTDGQYTLSDSITREQLYPLFNVNPEDAEQKANWEKYFYYRFLPVYITFVNVLAKYNLPVELTKMDENLTFKEMQPVAKDTMISAKELSPYSVMDSGFGGERKVDLDQDEVFDIYKSISKRLDKDVRKGKVNKRLKDRGRENEKLDKEIAKDDKKLEAILTRNGYNADAVLKNPMSRLFGENIVTKGLDKIANVISAPFRAVGRGTEWIANKLGISNTLKDPATGEMSGRGGFSGLMDALLGRNTAVTQGTQGIPPAMAISSDNGGIEATGAPGVAPKNTIEFAKTFTKGLRIGNLTEAQTAALAANTAETESRFRQDAVNGYGYTGLYQFGGEALADIGFMKRLSGKVGYRTYNAAMKNPSNWNNGLSLEKFKASRELQDKAYVALANKNISYGRGGAGSNRAQFDSITSDYRQMAKFLKMAHLKGAGNAVKGLLYGKDASDGNGTSMIGYGDGAAKKVQGILEALGGSSATLTGSNTSGVVVSTSSGGSPLTSVMTPQGSKYTGKSNMSTPATIADKLSPATVLQNASNGGKPVPKQPGIGVLKSAEVGGNDNADLNSKADKVVLSIPGESMPAKAARIARKRALRKSSGWCSRYVRTALQQAGYKLAHPQLAYENHTLGRLAQCGFVQIHAGTRWQIGDVIVNNSNNGGAHAGHIQIWDGQNWISDFIQPRVVHYATNRQIAYYRDARYLNGATKVSGWQDIGMLSGVGSNKGLPMSDIGGEGYTEGAVVGSVQYKKWEMKKITSSDELHGRTKAEPAKTTEKPVETTSKPDKTNASHGKDDQGKSQSAKLKKDTAVTVTKTTKGSTVGTDPSATNAKGNTKASTTPKPISTVSGKSTEEQQVKDTLPDRSAETKALEEKIRQQKQQERDLQQQQAKNEAMLKLLQADRNILEKQLMIQNDMLSELKGIHQHLKQWKVGEPNPMGNQSPSQVLQPKPEPVRPKAPDSVLEPVSMLKS